LLLRVRLAGRRGKFAASHCKGEVNMLLDRSSLAIALAAGLWATTAHAQVYFVGSDGHLMPQKKDQPPPDLRHFNQARK